MEEQQQVNVKKSKIPGFRSGATPKKIIAVAGYVFIVLAIIGSFLGDPREKSEEAFGWSSAEINIDNVKTSLAQKAPATPIRADVSFHSAVTDVRVVPQSDGGTSIWIYYTPGSAWDETDAVKKIGGTAIIIGSILFQNPQVVEVAVFAQDNMTDTYGNANKETLVKIVLGRGMANKANWDELANMHSTDPGNIYRLADNYNIHLGILKYVKTDEVRLK